MHYRELERRFGRATTRRTFLMGAGAAALGGLLAGCGGDESVRFVADPFSLGVASGDPQPDGFVLWTRLAPDPLNGGGMPAHSVAVQWQVATDDAMRTVVRRGVATASPEWAHSVHVEVGGLEPDRPYWYRFTAGAAASPTGRTRTAPAAGAMPGQFRFAFASCQNWYDGHFAAYRDLAAQNPDLVIHLGDYIYESAIATNGVRTTPVPDTVRIQPRTLEQYRLRYALYKGDPHLREAHRVAPWIVTWDDHEVVNDYAGDTMRPYVEPQAFLLRRAAAYQAYYEHQPLRAAAAPRGPNLLLYRRLAFGGLVDFHVLDTRQYRSPQYVGCPDFERATHGGYCAAALDPARTLLGPVQRRWLLDGLAASPARWTVLANQVFFAQRNTSANPQRPSIGGDGDKWDGYAPERDAVLRALAAVAARSASNAVVITGDIHRNYVNDLKTDWDDPGGRTTVGTEFVGTSISSEGDTPLRSGGFTTRCRATPENPHQVFYDDHRGYVLCTVTPERWRSEYRVLPSVREPDAAAQPLASFAIESGRPGAQTDAACAAG